MSLFISSVHIGAWVPVAGKGFKPQPTPTVGFRHRVFFYKNLRFTTHAKTIVCVMYTTILCSCSANTSGIKAACAVFQPITYSSRDTPETVAQVEAYDIKWERTCR